MSKKSLSGKIIGGAIFFIALAAVIYFKPSKTEEPEDLSVRPIKTATIGEVFRNPNLYFPGIVAADARVDLSFNVTGQLLKLAPVKGQKVKKGELLAQLDDRSFKNEVDNAQAELTRTQSTLKRMEKALKTNAISKEDYSKAKADYDKAMAQLEITKKNFEDTVIKARFDGVVADIYVDKFDTLQSGTPILSLQDNSLVNIEVAIPEQYVIHKRGESNLPYTFHAVFDALPNEQFKIKMKEYSTSANARTQTYTVSFQMALQDKFNIFPGMSATVVVEDFRKVIKSVKDSTSINSDYVGIDSDGTHFVWVLTKTEETGIYTVSKRTIKVGKRSGTTIEVLDGVKKGEQIAAAGITILTTGRRVSILTAKADKEG